MSDKESYNPTITLVIIEHFSTFYFYAMLKNAKNMKASCNYTCDDYWLRESEEEKGMLGGCDINALSPLVCWDPLLP